MHIKEINMMNIMIYRPPDTEIPVFEVILKELKKILEKIDKPDPTIILKGDCNFSFVYWKRLLIFGDCEWEYISYKNATRDQKAQFENLMKVYDSYSMLQTIEESTRKETTGKGNTLDLLFTNEIEMMGDVNANGIPVSDHKRVEIDTRYCMNSWHNINKQSDDTEEPLRQLNFHSKKVNWDVIIEEMKTVQWKEKFENGSVIANTREMMDKIEEICQANVPKKCKQYCSSSKISRERKNCFIGSGCLREINIEHIVKRKKDH